MPQPVTQQSVLLRPGSGTLENIAVAPQHSHSEQKEP
jgi:hypothetical protein